MSLEIYVFVCVGGGGQIKTGKGVSGTLVKSVYQKLIFLFLNQNICCGYSKEPSQ